MPTNKDNPTAGEIAQNDVPKGDTPVETNFPDVDPTQPQPEEAAATEQEQWKPGAGEIWAIWTGQQPGERILTVADLKEIGDKNAEEPLVWDANNRFRREVSDVHPQVLQYIDELDGDFTVVRYE